MKALSFVVSSLAAALVVGCPGPVQERPAAGDDARAKEGARRGGTPGASASAGEGSADKPAVEAKPGPDASDAFQRAALAKKVARFATAELTADLSALPAGEQEALRELIEAARQLDPLFDHQAYAGNAALEKELAAAQDELGKAKYAYFRIMRGPWDRQDEFAPFATTDTRPAGGGYYPADLTEEEFRGWVAAHPDDKEALESLLTVVQRKGDTLVARRYSEVYKQWLDPAAQHMAKAADATKNASLATFLRSRAAAFASDNYYESDKDWMDLDSRVEITIGPYETYEDHLLGLKAAFEAFVTVSDPKASEALAKYKKYLPLMEENLPIPKALRTTRGAESPIRVVDLVFTSGDARKSVQTIAFNLPNDERVRKEKGAKKVLLRNLIRTKFDTIMKPIGEQVLDADLHANLSGDAFFNQVLFHELSHSLGPAFTELGGKKVEIRIALGANYSALEECKADVMGAYNILFMIDKGEFAEDFRAKLLTSYFAGLFRSVRFGISEAHGRGAAVQINRYLADGAVTFDEGRAVFSIDADKLEQSIGTLVHDLVLLQHEGDKAKADAFLDKLGVMSAPMNKALSKLEGIAVDIRPIYPLAGETGPR